MPVTNTGLNTGRSTPRVIFTRSQAPAPEQLLVALSSYGLVNVFSLRWLQFFEPLEKIVDVVISSISEL